MPKVTIPYTPRYPDIHATLESHRFVVLVAHRRFGKTVLSINHVLRQAVLCRKLRGSYAYVAPFRHQAKTIAWQYLKHYSAPLPGRVVNETELKVTLPNGASVRLYGADNPDALRGQYFDGVILDEVAQMKAEVWGEIIQPALADRQGWALFIGTPKGVNIFSELYQHAARRQAEGDPLWAALRFPVTETQALLPDEVERLKAELSDNAFRQEMLCDFTASNDNALLHLDEVEAAMRRNPDVTLAATWPLVVGVDVARYGDDATVFFGRRGLSTLPPLVLRKLSNTDVAHRLLAWIAEYRPSLVCIDQGQGTGVIDLVRDMTFGRDVRIVEVPFGSRALQPDRFANRRAELWWSVRDWIRGGGCLPQLETLTVELTAPTYSYTATGLVQLEAKEAIKSRIQHSTDVADALALTFAVPLEPDRESVFSGLDAHYGIQAAQQTREWLYNDDMPARRGEYDPFAGL